MTIATPATVVLSAAPIPDLGAALATGHGWEPEDPGNLNAHIETVAGPHHAWIRLLSQETPPIQLASVWTTQNAIASPFAQPPDLSLSANFGPPARASDWHDLGQRSGFEVFWLAGLFTPAWDQDNWRPDAAVFHKRVDHLNGYVSTVAFDFDGDGDYTDCVVELRILKVAPAAVPLPSVLRQG